MAGEEVSNALGKKGIERCGYKIVVPANMIKDVSGIRVFAISEGLASELSYPNRLKGKGTDESLLKRIAKLFSRETSYILNPDYIITPKGTISIIPGALAGNLDTMKAEYSSFFISGWPVDPKKEAPVEGVLIFEENEFVAFIRPDDNRPDIGKVFGSDMLTKRGFHLKLPADSMEVPGRVRLFAVSGKVSSEIIR